VFLSSRLTQGSLSTYDLLYLLAEIGCFYNENISYLFYKTWHLNEEVTCTDSSPLVSVPWLEVYSEILD